MIKRNIPSDLLSFPRKIHFIGIGGIGMSSIARVLHRRGHQVSGSDIKNNDTVQALKLEGIRISIGQGTLADHVIDFVIYSTAIHPDNHEFQAVLARGIPLYHRAEILSLILNRAKTSVAVTGTHGKTTTSSMISFALSRLSKNPTCFLGGNLIGPNSNTIVGGEDLLVAEVDESDKTHEYFEPNYAVITNLEMDHVDHYHGFDEMEASFSSFFGNLKNPGVIISCADDSRLQSLIRKSGKPNISYGLSASADFVAENITLTAFGSEFDFIEFGLSAQRVYLNVPGIHNVLNSMAAIVVLMHLGLELPAICESLREFCGAKRRLEIKWKTEDLIVVDDYAHHPTELKASIEALKKMGKRITLIFQPHRYTRTLHFYNEFIDALMGLDDVILTEVYAAGEDSTLYNVGSQMIVDRLQAAGMRNARFLDKNHVSDYLYQRNDRGGIVAFLGAGDIGEIADGFANRFKSFTPA